MSNKTLARRYALALVSLGKEANCLAELADSLDRFSLALQEGNKMLYRVLSNPAIPPEEKKNVVREVAKVLSLHEYATNTMLLLLERERLAIVPALVISFTEMADKLLNRLRAVVTSAQALNPEEQASLKNTLSQAHSVPLENLFVRFEVNQELIGGVVAKVGDRIYDASVRRTLNDLQQILTQ